MAYSALTPHAIGTMLQTIGMALGLCEAATQSHTKAHYLAGKLCEIDGVELAFFSPFSHQFAIKMPRAVAEVNSTLFFCSSLSFSSSWRTWRLGGLTELNRVLAAIMG